MLTPFPERAKTGARAEMRHDNPSFRQSRGVHLEPQDDTFVGTPGEAIATNARLAQRVRQTKVLGHARHGMMKGRIEAGDLRRFRPRREQGAHGAEIVRPAPRVKRREGFKGFQTRRRNPFGRDLTGPAVHNAMAYRG